MGHGDWIFSCQRRHAQNALPRTHLQQHLVWHHPLLLPRCLREPLQWLAVPLQWLAIRLVLRTHCDRLETSDSLQGLWLHCVILCGNHPLHMIVHTPQRSLCHKHMWWGCAMVASHTREQWRLWRHFCEGWSRIPPEEGMKHLSLVLSPLHVEESLRLFSVWLQMSLHCHDFACGYPSWRWFVLWAVYWVFMTLIENEVPQQCRGLNGGQEFRGWELGGVDYAKPT